MPSLRNFTISTVFLFIFQKMLTDVVKNILARHRNDLKQGRNIDVDPDLANGYITCALQVRYEKNYFSVEPNNVKPRMSEEELNTK